jgi:hypothetical protein
MMPTVMNVVPTRIKRFGPYASKSRPINMPCRRCSASGLPVPNTEATH